MKKFLLFIFLVSYSFVLQAQSDIDYLKQSLAISYATAQAVISNYNYGYYSGVSTIAMLLRVNQSFILSSYFNAHDNYIIIAGGDEDVASLRVEVLDSLDYVYASNRGQDKNFIGVKFSPFHSGVYKVKITLAAGNDIKSYCSLLILQENGINISFNTIGYTFDKIFQDVRILEQGPSLHFGGVEVCFYGITLGKENTGAAFDGINLEGSDPVYFFYARGDMSVTSLNVSVYNNITGVTLYDKKIGDGKMVMLRPPEYAKLVRLNVRKQSFEPSYIAVIGASVR